MSCACADRIKVEEVVRNNGKAKIVRLRLDQYQIGVGLKNHKLEVFYKIGGWIPDVYMELLLRRAYAILN